MGMLAVASCSVYIAVVLGLEKAMPLPKGPYIAPMLWPVAAATTASTVLPSLMATLAPGWGGGTKDQRDKENLPVR